jgi:hypothetical protein
VLRCVRESRHWFAAGRPGLVRATTSFEPSLSASGATDRHVLGVSAATAGTAGLLLALVVPQGGDAPAHLYRTLLVQHGALLWDNLWFAGQYPLASYTLLYYPVAAVVGNTALAAAAVVLSALLFASLVLRAFGSAARWPAYAFATLAGGQFFTGDYPYTVAKADPLSPSGRSPPRRRS